MQSLATMLGQKGPVKITTALLAKKCGITEAAIYRHFPSKKSIYSGLVNFCEQSIFDLIGGINKSNEDPLVKVKRILLILISFCEKNPGLAKLLTREAFSSEEAELDERIILLFAKIELQIKQNLQKHEQSTKNKLSLSTAASANLLLATSEGLIQQLTRLGFTEKQSARSSDQLDVVIRALVL